MFAFRMSRHWSILCSRKEAIQIDVVAVVRMRSVDVQSAKFRWWGRRASPQPNFTRHHGTILKEEEHDDNHTALHRRLFIWPLPCQFRAINVASLYPDLKQ